MRSQLITPEDMASKRRELGQARRRVQDTRDEFRKLAGFVGLPEEYPEEILREIEAEHAPERRRSARPWSEVEHAGSCARCALPQ
jgi:hypothetical protein